jgi:hypothetical protein
MSSGQQSCMDDILEAEDSRRKERFRKYSEDQVITSIREAVYRMNLFIKSDPALTKTQWNRIDSALTFLQKLI